MIEYSLSEQTEIPPGGEFSVKVIGVGGAGANVLDRMALEGSDEADLLTLNTDVRALSTSVSTNKLQLGTTLLKGMGAGGDPELGRQAALEAIDEIRESVRGYKMAFVCVGLGGGTGSGAAPEVCRVAKEEGVFLVVFATLPFSFEGKRRMDQALESLDRIGNYANAVVTFENDRMGELIVPKDGVQQAFAAADKIISQSIRATTGIVSHPGIIRIGMDELLSALDTKKSRCLFGFGQAKGDNRAHEALEQALKSPLLDKGKLLQDAKNVLIHVGGGDGMTLFEVELVMQELAKHIDENRTQILFGTGTDKSLGSSLTVTVISSLEGPGVDRPPPGRTPDDDDRGGSGPDTSSPPVSTSPLAGAVEALESEDASAPEADAEMDEETAVSDIFEDDVAVEAEEEDAATEVSSSVVETIAAQEEPAAEDESEEEIITEKESTAPVAETKEAELIVPPDETEEAEVADDSEIEAVEEIFEEEEIEEPAAIEEVEAAVEEIEEEPEAVEVEPEAIEEEPVQKAVEPHIIQKKVVQALPARKPVIDVPVKRTPALNITPVPPAAKKEEDSEDSGGWSGLESPESIGKLLQQGKKANEEVDLTADTIPIKPPEHTIPINPIGAAEKPKISIRDLVRQGREEEVPVQEPEIEVEDDVEEEEMIVAETEDSQKITLSRLVPGVGGKAPRDPQLAEEPVSPMEASSPIDLGGHDDGLEIDAVTAQQQQMLQLEPLSKGRFAKTEPTIVDGEDMDVPTFLRKRRK